MIAVIEIDVVNPSSLEVVTLRVTSGRHFVEGTYQYLPVVSELPSVSQSILSSSLSTSAISASSGTFSLSNVDGEFDYLESWGLTGRSVRIRIADTEESSTTEFIVARITYAIFELDRVVFNLSNSIEDINVPSIVETFEGGNLGPVGLEGTDEGVKGQLKPFMYGRVFNVAPVQVNSSLLIYALNYDIEGNRKEVHKVWAVRDKGGLLRLGQDHADSDALAAADVGISEFDTCLSEGLVRLGTVPVGQVTVDVDAAPLDGCTASEVVKDILIDRAGKDADTGFDYGSLSLVSSGSPCLVGIYVNSESTLESNISEVLSSVGGWITSQPNGKYVFGKFNKNDFYSYPVKTLTLDDFVSGTVARLPTGFEDKNIPSYKLELGTNKNYFVSSDVLVSVPATTKELLTTPYTYLTEEDASVLDLHPTSKPQKVDTLVAGNRYAGIRSSGLNSNDAFGGFFNISSDSPAWTGAQTSGSGGSFSVSAAGMSIVSGTGVYTVNQTVEKDGALLSDGSWKLTVTKVSGNGSVSVNSNIGYLYSGSVSSGPEEISAEFVVDATVDWIDIQFTSNNSGSVETAVFKALRVQDNLGGFSQGQTFELSRRSEILFSRQSRYSADTDFSVSSQINIGELVTLKFDRYGLTDGKTFMVVEKTTILSDETDRLVFWRVE